MTPTGTLPHFRRRIPLKLCEITIVPKSGFGTPLKGDTLFGHFCWQARHDDSLLDGGLVEQIREYSETPFAVFSSAVTRLSGPHGAYAVKRPNVPGGKLFGRQADRRSAMKAAKENKKKNWLLLDRDLKPLPLPDRFAEECDLLDSGVNAGGFIRSHEQHHNTINRSSGRTGSGMFAPYVQENRYYAPGITLAVFVVYNDLVTDPGRLAAGMERIGSWGFGRDASTGLGRFSVEKVEDRPVPGTDGCSSILTLAPCLPDMAGIDTCYKTTFVRFGRHGDLLATSANPFKNPVVMADESAYLVASDRAVLEKPYIGKAISGVSITMPETVTQGYAPYIPLTLEA